jgi:hypothetical protein
LTDLATLPALSGTTLPIGPMVCDDLDERTTPTLRAAGLARDELLT